MKIKTSRFGIIKSDESQIIKISKGLYGFIEADKFVIIESEESEPFKWLQSVDFPNLAFVIVEPEKFFPDYKMEIPFDALEELNLKSEEDAKVYVVVVIPPDPKKMTANMLGPIVINSPNMLGKQVVISNEHYSVRHSIIS